MAKNPILEELYEIRSQILAEHGENLSEYLHNEFERLKSEGHPVAKIKQRRIRRETAETSFDSSVDDHSPLGER